MSLMNKLGVFSCVTCRGGNDIILSFIILIILRSNQDGFEYAADGRDQS